MRYWLLAVRISLVVLVTTLSVPLTALGQDNPVIVRQSSNNNDLTNDKQIIRTSTGRLYYFNGNAGHTSTWDGWVEAETSLDGHNWVLAGSQDQWYSSTAIGVTVDASNIIHMVTYDWNNHPYYRQFNTADSPKGDHSWEPVELLESLKTGTNGRCAITVDANGKPHLVYLLQ